MANMQNPRKFSEKIALQKQKQAEGTAEFEKIMKEVNALPLSSSQQRIDCCLSPEQQQQQQQQQQVGGGGGGGVGNHVSGGIPIPGSGGGSGNGGSSSPTAYRESRGRSVGVGPMRRPSDRKTDRSPYSNQGIYLSPPSMDSNWRRSNSDSAIHQSLILGPENPIYGTSPQQQQHFMQQQQYHPNQRSHSPAASVGLSPTAQRRKAQQMVAQQHSHSSSSLQQMQLQQDQLNHHKMNHQQNHNHQHQQHQHQQQQHQQQQQQQQQVAAQMNHNMHPHLHQQQNSLIKSQLQFNACGPTNSVYKSLQEQAMAMANTGSLPDLTSVHFSNVPSPSPTAISQHNNNMRNEREQSQSPFSNQSYQTHSQQQQQQLQSPGGGAGGGGGGQTHLSFSNLPVMVNQQSSPNHISQSTLHSSYGNLPSASNNVTTIATSTSNLTEYRNPQLHNPPSPAGSASPGLMVANSPHDMHHNSAPNSPIRHQQQHQQQQQQQQQQYSDKNIQTYDRFSPIGEYSNGSNNLNPSFHNHFAEFSLVDTATGQNDSQYIPTSLQQDLHSPHNSYSQTLQFDDSLFGHHSQFSTENGNGGGGGKVGSSGSTNTSGGDPYLSLSNQNSLNNCVGSSNLGLSGNSGGGGGSGSNNGGNNNNNSSASQTTGQAGGGGGTASASCSPLHSPHSPNPHSPSNNNSNLVNDIASIAQQQQKSHNTNDGNGGGAVINNTGGGGGGGGSNMHNSTPSAATTPNIPSIVFSDFSSSTDYSKEIFDTLDLDLGQMDPAGLQMLSDPSSMIADPNIEDSFRRDLN